MNLFGSSGKKYKRAAERALRTAEDIQDYQSEVELRRNLISNIRQERIARAQLEVGNYSTTARSSSAAGALANIDSSLAGEAYFSYASSDRAQRVQELNEYAQKMYKKYEKKQKNRATTMAIAGIAAGALTGGALGAAGLAGGLSTGMAAITGAQIGQGIGQIAANTGATDYGIQNILGGIGTGYSAYRINTIANALRARQGYYVAESINSTTGQVIPGTSQTISPIDFLGQ